MIVLGVDPDLRNTGLALADEHRVYAVAIVQVNKKLKGKAAVIAMAAEMGPAIRAFCEPFFSEIAGVVVEGQQLYLGGGAKSKPEDLLNLACVTGAAILAGRGFVSGCESILRPLPREWKGEVPKAIHQARTCTRLGWGYEAKSDYVIPEVAPSFESIKPLGNWKHCMDAIGLAWWGSMRLKA